MGAAARRQRGAAAVPLFALRHTTKLCSVTSCRSGAWTAILSPAICAASFPAPGVASHHPGRAGLQSWPSASNRTLFRCFVLQKFPGNRGILFCIVAFSVSLGPYRAPPGGAKRVGEVRWPDSQAVLPHPITQPAFVQLPSAAAQVGSSVTLARRLSPPGRNLGQPSPQGRLCPYISRSSFSFLALSASTSLMNLSVRFWMSFSAIL